MGPLPVPRKSEEALVVVKGDETLNWGWELELTGEIRASNSGPGGVASAGT